MDLKRSVIAVAFAGFAMTGISAPVFAESGIIVPRGPVLSMRDPVFLGLLTSPGTSKCRQLRNYYEWKCTYGGVPRHFDRFGDRNLDQQKSVRAKFGKVKQVRAAKRKGLAGSVKTVR